MLDHEPDTNQPTEGPTSTDGGDQPAAPAPRRRRAASRPAGPPSSAPAAPPVVTADAGEPVAAEVPSPAPATPAAEPGPVTEPAAEAAAEPAPTRAPAKRAPRKAAAKRPAKKTATAPATEAVAEAPEAAPEVSAEAPAAETPAESPAPAKRAPRKRTAKKVTTPAAELSADDLVAAVPDVGPAATPPAESPGEPGPESELPVPEAPGPGAWAAEEAVAEVLDGAVPAELPDTEEPDTAVPAALQELADAIARDGQVQDALDRALETTPSAELAPLEESPLDVLESSPGDARVETTDETPVPPDESDEDDDAEGDEAESESRDGDGSRRRRRRRGGRRRRRTGDDDSGDHAEGDAVEGEPGEEDEPAAGVPGVGRSATPAAAVAGEEEEEPSESEEEESDGARRRRRRRRRRGEETGTAADDPAEVVVRVREPRRGNTRSASSEVTGIEGSTRMEAKRQRRRDGREAGRRRVPILSEAEFLARREAVSRKMIVRQADDLSQIAVIEDDILVEHYVDRDSAASLIGNVYLGRVQNVLPSMEAAFVDIGRGRNAVLYAGEVDWDSFGAEGQGRKVERVLKSGQTILVQVTKDPVGAKGARLTNHVSIPGRYIVYAPSGHLSGISRKLPDTERRRLKDILADLIGEASVIVRTAAEGASEEELVRDVNRLKAQWADIEKKVAAGQSPQLLYGEPDLTVRIVRDLFTEDFSELIIQGNGGLNDAHVAVEAYVGHVAPHLADRLRAWDPQTQGDLFREFRLDEQIAKGLERKVFLPSGGSLVIDRTEAMTVIDVNTGKFTGSGGNLEATVTSNNLEAAEEIVRQLRLRDVGGIIVIDFIDMVLPANRELLLRRLVECLGRDRTRHQVAEVTSLGLVQMTRKKIGTGLAEAFTTECPHCHGRGVEIHDLPVESQRQADGGTRDSGRDSGRGTRRGGGTNGAGDHPAPVRQPRPPVPVPVPVAAGTASAPAPEPEAPMASPVVPAAEQVAEPAAATTFPAESPVAGTPVVEPAVVEPAVVEVAATGAAEVPAAEAPAVQAAEPAPRARRSGTRRRATREQGAPTVADPQAAPAADPHGEPAPSS